MEQLKRASSPYRFHIPDDLIPTLRSLRARQQDWRPLIDAEDVVHLFYGLGAARFLTFDGRILVDNIDWDGTGAYEVTEPKEAWSAVVVGADVIACPELLRLLPNRPLTAINCPSCGGAGWHFLRSADGGQGKMVCWDVCGGLGWVAQWRREMIRCSVSDAPC
jgi:hypothetical protein